MNLHRILILMLVTAAVFLVCVGVGGATVLSNSGGGSWEYQTNINIHENSGSTLTDYQLLLELNGTDFPTGANANGTDIRFSDSSDSELGYWIEEWDDGTQTARMWVKVPTILAGTSTSIKMWYGNPSAVSSSDGDATFTFFDDFDETSLNASKWTTPSFGMQPIQSVVISDSVLSFTGNGCGGSCTDGVSLRMNQNFDYDEKVAVNTKFRFTGDSWGSGAGIWAENSFAPVNLSSSSCNFIVPKFVGLRGNNFYNTIWNMDYVDWSGNDETQITTLSMNGPWYKSSLTKKNETAFNGTLYNDNSEVLGSKEYNVNFGDVDLTWVTSAVYSCGSRRYYYDWIFVRNYALIEPTITLNDETVVTDDVSPQWSRYGYDLANTHYYPYPSTSPVSISDFAESWSIDSATALTADINDDSLMEVIVTDGSALRAYDSDGTELWNTPTTSAINLIADVTGDTTPEIITSQRSSSTLQMHVFSNTGALIKTISKSGGSDSSISAVLASDLDGDGDIEIIAHQNAGYSRDPRGVSLFDYTTATELWYYDVGPAGDEAYGDINEDGILDVVRGGGTWHNGATGAGVGGTATTTTDSYLYSIAFNAIDGSELFTAGYTGDGQYHGYVDHAIVDLNHDGDYNILVFEGHDSTYYPGTSQIHLMDSSGAIYDTYNGPSNVYWMSKFAVGDLNADGYDEIVAVGDDGVVRVLDYNLNQIASTSSVSIKCYIPVINDINGDGINEVLVPDYDLNKVWIFDGSLNELGSFSMTDPHIITISDLDDDGINEIIVKGTADTKVFSVATVLDDGASDTDLVGDLNRNGIIDTGDATLALRMVVGLTTPDLLGDMNSNGIIDSGDATLMLRAIVGLE